MRNKNKTLVSILIVVSGLSLMGCDERQLTSDVIQQRQQETLLQEATAQTGMPSLPNFFERKLLKMILEMRDQKSLVTYTYLENQNPVIIKGHTACGGKLTYIGQTIGFGIPYATQYTNPQKLERYPNGQYIALPQADPNGLFSPASAEGTWILMQNPNGKDITPVYIESRIFVTTFMFTMD